MEDDTGDMNVKEDTASAAAHFRCSGQLHIAISRLLLIDKKKLTSSGFQDH